MPTLRQLLNNGRKPQKSKIKTPALGGCPQRTGLIFRMHIMHPKKPNSAARKVARVLLRKTGAVVIVYRPGEEKKSVPCMHSDVLIQGGRPKDLPGVRYKLICGKLGSPGIPDRTQGRSQYGARKPEDKNSTEKKVN